jgi:hypothetical protein
LREFLIDLQINEQTMTVPVLPGPQRRRQWTTAEEFQILQESQTAEMPVVKVARRHGVHPINYMAGDDKCDWDDVCRGRSGMSVHSDCSRAG